MNVYLGIDVGGTHIKLAVIDSSDRVRARGMIDTEAGAGPAPAFDRIAAALPTLMPARGRLAAVGIGCAGLIDTRRGYLYSSPNLPTWQNTSLVRIAQRRFGVYTTIENDANAAAYGEFKFGGRKRLTDLILITLGTGVGGGVVTSGRLLKGAADFAGEVGHMTVDPAGPRCGCGNRGCLEAYLGSRGLARTTRAMLKKRRGRILSAGGKLSPERIMGAAREGDAVGKAVVKDAGMRLGIAVASLVNVFNPQVVALGGGVSASFDLLRPHVEHEVSLRAFAEPARMARIEPARLRNDASALGAAALARESNAP